MLIAHLSDLHLFTERAETGETRADIARVIAALVADINALDPRPDIVVISGDLADGGTPEDYRCLAALLAPLAMPVMAVPGNHDRRCAMREGLAHRLSGLAEGAFLNARVDMAEVTLLGLDTVIPASPVGALCSERLDWLAQELRSAAASTVIVMHHPPVITGNPHWDTYSLIEGRERLGQLLGKTPRRILCGHIHQPFHTQWGAHYVSVAGSPAFEYHLSPGSHATAQPAPVPFSYPLHHIRPTGDVLVYRRHVRF
ncbi:metallophosphoesterase [Halomonas dongshanensis]|uniref:Metallophosphoesterase n=1 Tax=Halomonas dongshanensis TaxID=2890835 RepID=A0ABT2EHC2_9GAMM|nr:metallophosphoesterase [Halomonas dongshanensis]MCS2610869.1 metallophosphoesterase [Halomonas dongshanensis]